MLEFTGWSLVLVAAVGMIGCLLIRGHWEEVWDAEARGLAVETRAGTTERLPRVLAMTTCAERNLRWPPARAGLCSLAGRWNLLAERAPGRRRRRVSRQLSLCLQSLVTAVDAENEALAAGLDWRSLQARLDLAERSTADALARQP